MRTLDKTYDFYLFANIHLLKDFLDIVSVVSKTYSFAIVLSLRCFGDF